jgi:glutathione synthase
MAAPACSGCDPGDREPRVAARDVLARYREPLVVQRFLPEVRKGDKRIILIDGKAAGAVNRVPAAGEARQHACRRQAAAEPTSLTKREHRDLRAIGPELRRSAA